MMINNFVKINYEIGSFKLFGYDTSYGYSILFFIYFFYFACFDFFNNGVTIGKKLLNISVVGKDFSLNTKQKLYRTFFKVVSISLLPITAIVFLFSEKTLQDKFSKTTTVNVA